MVTNLIIPAERSMAVFLWLLMSVGLGSFRLLGSTEVGGGLNVSGHYIHIFSNGALPKTNVYCFTALLEPAGYKITITNLNKLKEWGIIQYDGTNIYTVGAESLNSGKIYGHVYPGSFYCPEGDNAPHFFFPWMAFGLTPQIIQNFKSNGIAELPTPWGRRFSLLDYGFRWDVAYAHDGAIVQKISAVRDSSLDLKSEEEELHRATLNYAFEFSSRDHRLETLHARKHVPDGFIRAVYESQGVYQTNGWSIPATATFVQYWPNFRNQAGSNVLVFQMALQVDTVSLQPLGVISSIIAPGPASVFDYRYQATNSRTKFNYASYALGMGDVFPSGDDPKLRAQAEDWLKNGPAYSSLEPKRKKILAGMLMLALCTSGFLLFWLKNKPIQQGK